MRINLHNYLEIILSIFSENIDIQILLKKKDYFVFSYNERCYILYYVWEILKFPRIYLISKDEVYLSHIISSNSKSVFKNNICYINSENFSLYNKSPIDIFKISLEHFLEWANLDEKQQEVELQKEFLMNLRKNKNYKPDKNFLYLDSTKNAKEVVYFVENKKNSRNKITKEVLKRIFIDENIKLNKNIKLKNKKKSLYIPLDSNEGINPILEKWNIGKIMNYNISEKTYDFLKEYIVQESHFFCIFGMKISVDFEIVFLVEFIFNNNKSSNFLEKIEDLKELIPHKSERQDINYIMKRSGQNTNLNGKKVTVVGAGSLGSYIISELPNLGIMNLEIIDDDLLNIGNLGRHKLGVNHLNEYKVNGLKQVLEEHYPEVNVEIHTEKLELSNIETFNFENTDIIIIAIGSTDTQCYINEYFKKIKYNKPVLYVWLEAYGIGGHALLVDYSKEGCYNCIEENYESEIQFLKLENSKILTGDGCGGTFTPYGTNILLKTTALVLDILYNHLGNKRKYIKNPLFSIKNPKLDFEGKYNERFDEAEENLLENYKYIKEGCHICDNKI